MAYGQAALAADLGVDRTARSKGMTPTSSMEMRSVRAHRFGAAHFRDCEVHAQEARSVYDAIEQLARNPLPHLTPDITIEALVQHSEWLGAALTRDSLDVVEIVMALEEEFGRDLVPSEAEVSGELVTLALSRILLGLAADRTRWSSETIWSRSVRGVINERIRWRGGCTCSQNGVAGAVRVSRTSAMGV